jgi:hypothetical protein
MTPWLETSPDLASWLEYFPDRYYALALPALLLVFVLTCAITFIGSVLSSAGLRPHYLQSPSGNRDIGGARRMHLSPKRDTPVSMSKSSRSEGKPSTSCIFDTINSEKEVVGTPDVRTRGAHRRVKTVSWESVGIVAAVLHDRIEGGEKVERDRFWKRAKRSAFVHIYFQDMSFRYLSKVVRVRRTNLWLNLTNEISKQLGYLPFI